MKLWKKLAFTGVSALLLGTLAACGGSGSKDQAEASNSDTLQMYQIGDKPDNFDQLMEVANKRIEKEIGVKVNINYIGWGDYEKKMNVIISSGENYDIAFANNYVSNAQKGAFSDLTELAPKYAEKAYNDLDEAYIKGNLVNGKLYAFPVNGNVFAQQVLTFNKALLDKYDLSIDGIQSYADAEKVLKEFHEKEPNTAAFAIGQGFKVQGNFDYPLGNTLPFAIDLDGDDSKIINQYDNETYIGLLRTMHSWYKQGLIPSDAATSNKDYPLEGNTWLMRGETQGPYDYGDTILTNAAKQELVSKAITVPLKSTAQAQMANFVVSNTSKNKEKSYRNTMYTMLTRSFIRSYLVLPKSNDNGFTKEMYDGGQCIMKEKKIVVIEPTEKEQIDIKAWIKDGKQALSLEDRISNIFEELNITNPKIKEAIRKSLIGIPIKNNNAQLKELIQVFLNTIDNEDYFA